MLDMARVERIFIILSVQILNLLSISILIQTINLYSFEKKTYQVLTFLVVMLQDGMYRSQDWSLIMYSIMSKRERMILICSEMIYHQIHICQDLSKILYRIKI